MKNKFEEVATKIKEINEYYKENYYSHNAVEKVEKMVEDTIKFAREHNIPLKLSAGNIIENVKNQNAGEELEEESTEFEDSSY
jgi:uncharacterized protein YejL (UPF0352 family)